MAEKKKSNIFTKLQDKFKGVISELKRVNWPSAAKLKSICGVVFVVIIFFAVLLYAINVGAHYVLDKAGFYNEVKPTETTQVTETSAE